MLALRKHTPRPARLLLAIILIYAFSWIKAWPRHYDDDELPGTQQPQQDTSLGPHQVDSNQLVVSIITTANNVYTKLPPLILNTAEEHHGSLLLFSDLQTEVGDWPVFDVIWRYGSEFIKATKELGRYRTQVAYARKSIPLQRLNKADAEEEKKELATLDKYKILQAMAAAWEFRPDRSWYVFADDETWINRPGLLKWLSQHDPSTKHFFGNPPPSTEAPGPDPVAASGTSFILSRQVMGDLFVARQDTIQTWQQKIERHKSALHLVSSLLRTELQMDLATTWPAISAFDPSTAPFSPTLWCEPVLLMHHIPADLRTPLSKLERDWGATHTQLRFSDLWTRFMTPENLTYTRNDWDNLSADPANARWNILFQGGEGAPPLSGEESPDACKLACYGERYCMQWAYSSSLVSNWNGNPETRCHLSSSVRFGGFRWAPGEGEVAWRSGWRVDRFLGWAVGEKCGG
ncbi:hypothetical protein BDW02DRAFT_539382 [Decorospora gaudefroyi]|uniref:Glycosyltransferase family 31 protein n=1 Tax=Decorospora gaudefroyi TaxID=184978 RepID=A0A6A5KVB7_9PLEO|nr:hypothetical protein BDW02DRAFT_539382 [Decorospora gaudefroyi]